MLNCYGTALKSWNLKMEKHLKVSEKNDIFPISNTNWTREIILWFLERASTLKTVGKQNTNKFNYSQWHIYGEYNVAINDYKPTQTAL